MRAIALGLAGLLSLVGCADEGSDPVTSALQDLCRAVTEGATLDDQKSAFFDRAHDEIHRLAEEVTDEDAATAARLLEAKQSVESELAEADDPLPQEDFERLFVAIERALMEAGRDAPNC